MRRSLKLTLMTWSILLIPSLAFAAEGGTGSWVGPFAVLAATVSHSTLLEGWPGRPSTSSPPASCS